MGELASRVQESEMSRAAARVAALERRHRGPEAKPEIWIGFADADTFTGPGGQQQRRADLPGKRVITLQWGDEPEGQQRTGGQSAI